MAVSSNGIFRPVIVVDGRVEGIWKREIKRNKITIEAELFKHPEAATRNAIERASIPYGYFMGITVELKLNPTSSNQ